tara:strand:- start:2 stop:1015 length:1014 start_codon:yes stop_codon:yes gene_type:complete
MASAEDILNSLNGPTEDILEDYNVNTQAFEFPKEPPYDPSMAEIGFGIPGAQEGIESLFSGAKNLFNRGFITERPSNDFNINAGAYENMVPDERNVLQELPEILSNLEYKKIIANSVLNTPDMLLDLLTVAPQLGSEIGNNISNNGDFSDLGSFMENEPKFKELEYDDKFKDGERELEFAGSGAGAFSLYKYLKNKLPNFAQKGIAQWAPYMDKIATSSSKGNFFKNIFTGLPRGLSQTGIMTAPFAGITTFLNSKPLNAYADDWNNRRGNSGETEEYEGTPNRGTNSYTYAPKGADRNNPNEMRNAEVIQNSPQDSIQRYQIPARGPTGPWNNYRD